MVAPFTKAGESADVAGMEPKFSAYDITQDDDPVSLALRGLVDSASGQDRQIAMLWKAVEQLSVKLAESDCVPKDALRKECFEAEKLNQLIGK
jgi:serine O-acetyltransferase